MYCNLDVFVSIYAYMYFVIFILKQYLLQCAEQLPHKIPLYGTLVCLLYTKTSFFLLSFN